ncbi:MAG: hypothetical protein ACP5KD_08860 [Fervidobacterium sp.]|jgi:ubiquinone biosynthesis protein Coq4
MGLFASNETVRLYVDAKGNITPDKQTDAWFDVLKELPVAVAKTLQQAFGKPRVEYKGDQQVITIEDLETLPLDFLARVIVGWSEKEPVTPQNIAKLRHDIAKNLYQYLTKMYSIE